MTLSECPKCEVCGLLYGNWQHPPGMHYDPTAYACCGVDCECGSDNAWGFCHGCMEELFGGIATHDHCSPFVPANAEKAEREMWEWQCQQ